MCIAIFRFNFMFHGMSADICDGELHWIVLYWRKIGFVVKEFRIVKFYLLCIILFNYYLV